MRQDTLRHYAMIGAQVRLTAIVREIEALQSFIEGTHRPPTVHKVNHVLGKGAHVYERKSLHWTQRPENAAKLAKMHRKAQRTRRKQNGHAV